MRSRLSARVWEGYRGSKSKGERDAGRCSASERERVRDRIKIEIERETET